MQSSSRPSRTTSKLSDSVLHQLNRYALAAGAAGVSALALTQTTEAKIVYTKTQMFIGKNHNYQLDLNHDGTADFKFWNNALWSDTYIASLNVIGSNASNKVVGVKHYLPGYASALYRGAHI